MATKKLQINILIVISEADLGLLQHPRYISEAALQNFPHEKLTRTILRAKVSLEIYRRAYILKCDFNKITFQHGHSPLTLLDFSEQLFIRTLLEGCS